jgi:hypothetical protein
MSLDMIYLEPHVFGADQFAVVGLAGVRLFDASRQETHVRLFVES